MRALSLVVFFSLAASAAACNAIMDLGRFEQAVTPPDAGGPTTVADAGGGGGGPGDAGVPEVGTGPFDCLNLPHETLDPGQVSMHLTITNATAQSETASQLDGGSDIDIVVYTPYPGVTIQSCTPLDPGCANPLATLVTDDAGGANFSLTGNFTGFFRGKAPGIVPFTFFPGQWLTGLKSASYFTSALTPSDEDLLNAALGGAADLDAGSGLGEVFFVIFDCDDHHVSGATLTLSRSSSETLPFYILSGVPSTSASQTDSDGVGGALNMPAGTLHATAMLAATQQTLGSVDVYVRAGELTYAWIRMRVH